jgi:hypothetical protein
MSRRVRHDQPRIPIPEALLISLLAFLIALALLFTTGALSPAHGGTCPSDTLLGDELFSPSASNVKSYGDGLVRRGGAYDLVGATLSGSSRSIFDLIATIVIARDEYVLTGLPVGSPVSFDVELNGTATLTTGSGTSGLSVRREGGAIASRGGGNWSGPVVLHLDEKAGEPFVLRYALGQSTLTIGTLTEVSCSGSFHFLNLPPGSHITSCQGYVQDAVPTATASWGMMKAIYR